MYSILFTDFQRVRAKIISWCWLRDLGRCYQKISCLSLYLQLTKLQWVMIKLRLFINL